jgi:scyllo-inositol 2-dehydrogenase (NADP+)
MMGAGQGSRVGLVGFGLGGAVFHAPLIDAVPALSLASIVTTDPERVARARERYPSARVLPDVETLLASTGEHDLVVVTTPNRSHVPIALAALEAGAHVVVDKPLAASAADGRRLASAAADRGLMLTVFQNRRYDGDFLTVRRLIAEGTLGPVFRFESRFERWNPELRADAWRERAAPEDAGGLLFDLGSHLVDQAVQLFGPPTRVYAEVEPRRAGAEVDDDSFVALHHAGGVVSHLWMSQVAGAFGPRFRVLGLGGAFVKHGLDPQEDQLAAGLSPEHLDFGREPRERWGSIVREPDAEIVPTERGDYPRFYADVAEAIIAEAAPPVSPEDAISTLAILEAALRSAATGAVVELGG